MRTGPDSASSEHAKCWVSQPAAITPGSSVGHQLVSCPTSEQQQIVSIRAASRGTYGVPRITAELREGGEQVGRGRVARLMRMEGLEGITRRRWRKTTIRGRLFTKSGQGQLGSHVGTLESRRILMRRRQPSMKSSAKGQPGDCGVVLRSQAHPSSGGGPPGPPSVLLNISGAASS